jgi:hypothetical protein
MTTALKLKALLALVFFLLGFFTFCLWKFLSFSEPPFVILGDTDFLKKLHINVYMDRDTGNSSWKTIFIGGKSYEVDNAEVDRFFVYVNYDNKLFVDYSYDNIARMVNDTSIAPNTLLFCRRGSAIFLSDRFKKCSEITSGEGLRELVPLEYLISRDVAQAKNNGHLHNKASEDAFVRDLRSAFFDVVTEASGASKVSARN